MRAWVVLSALLGHWRRHPVELATLLIGLAVATALWSGVQALNAQARASYDQGAAMLGRDALAQVEARDGQRFQRAAFVALRRAGWPVSPVLEGTLRREDGDLRVIGIEPITMPADAQLARFGAGAERFTTFIRPPYLALATPPTVARLDGADGLPPLEAAEDLPPDTLLVDIGAAERLLDAEGRVSRLLLPAAEAERILPPHLAARLQVSPPGTEGALDRLTDSFHLNLTAFGFLSFVVGLFIVYSAIGLAFEQRKPAFRTLRACGVSARMLAGVMLAELLALALLAGLAGVVAGYGIAAALLPDVAASLRGLYGAQVPGSLSLSPAWWLAGMAISVLGALVAAASSLWRVWRLPLLATAQPEAWLEGQRRSRALQLAAAILIGIGALSALVFGDGLIAGFAVMGGLLLAAALVLPALLAAVLQLGAARARRPVVQWAWADGRQQLSGLSLALMALLLALAVNVGVGTMVKSFRATFLGWLDQRLASEVYLSGRDGAEAAEIAHWLSERPEVAAVLPLWAAETRLGTWPVEVNGFVDHPTYRDNWPLIAARPDAWDLVASGDALLVSEQLARREGLSPGGQVTLPTPDGPWPVEVAAIYSDYGNPQGQVMIAHSEFGRRWPEADKRRMAVRMDPADVGPVTTALRAAFDLGLDRIVDQAALKALSRQVFEKTFAVTVALNALTLAVAGIALLTSLLTLSNLRLTQLAPLWALGLTRRRLALIEITKALALAGLTAFAALPLGLAVAWVLTAVINVQAFGWRLPVFLYPGQWAGLLALALATALLAALWPALRLRRASPLTLLQSFSNER